jgi:hypothetical protein
MRSQYLQCTPCTKPMCLNDLSWHCHGTTRTPKPDASQCRVFESGFPALIVSLLLLRHHDALTSFCEMLILILGKKKKKKKNAKAAKQKHCSNAEWFCKSSLCYLLQPLQSWCGAIPFQPSPKEGQNTQAANFSNTPQLFPEVHHPFALTCPFFCHTALTQASNSTQHVANTYDCL